MPLNRANYLAAFWLQAYQIIAIIPKRSNYTGKSPAGNQIYYYPCLDFNASLQYYLVTDNRFGLDQTWVSEQGVLIHLLYQQLESAIDFSLMETNNSHELQPLIG